MKKVTILSQPTPIETIQLDKLDYDLNDDVSDRAVRLQIRKWRRLRHQH